MTMQILILIFLTAFCLISLVGIMLWEWQAMKYLKNVYAREYHDIILNTGVGTKGAGTVFLTINKIGSHAMRNDKRIVTLRRRYILSWICCVMGVIAGIVIASLGG